MLNITKKEFDKLAAYVKSNYGINLTEKKKTLVVGRLHNILQQMNFKSFSDYYDYVISDTTGEALTTLINKITTNHTFFMREPDHFEFFASTVLPYLTATIKGSMDLRIWSAGCSSGEEPYTLAMIIADFFGAQKAFWDTRILATDISMNVIQKAKRGIYSSERIEGVPDSWRRKYFRKIDESNWAVADSIRNEVIFRIFNLMNTAFPFKKKFHVIFCRNVMIYFDQQTKMELVNRFYEFTEPGGYLFIGHSESLNREETGYKYIMPAVYRKE
ncbi:CheR family methyltransferase [Acetivibrio straminisolvens]|jgi:chemotaxis protein methyltransferase CheR|uniref:protein-glutamate O-methyltransferase n=1 Tax=Acetivibrio straminisolvens JCM 21531 TaxID=1294263 RepID=W4V3I1_9FIRM|nr:protein-glutamate O-methyltransferase CheR [Acetivibrio straminisolvens]GAE87692.1 chemotaxis protein methyltransferase CheR [Acetivibrio straminisolvens JCM 21531]